MARKKEAETVQLKLRFSEKLRRRIEAAASENNRSMNAEIIRRLEQSFERVDIAKATAQAAITQLFKQGGPVISTSRGIGSRGEKK